MTARAAGGLYLVTLNNEELISVNAHDPRHAARAIRVNRAHLKVGKAEQFGRRKDNYDRTFGSHNVNYTPVVTVAPDDLQRAEKCVLEALKPYRMRGHTGRLNEWLEGVTDVVIRDLIFTTLKQEGIQHEAWTADAGGFQRAIHVEADRESPAKLSPSRNMRPANSQEASGQDATPAKTIAHLLELKRYAFDDQLFKRVHHLANASIKGHLDYCQELVDGGGDFRGETNRDVCRRLVHITAALRKLEVSGDEASGTDIEEIVERALRAFPIRSRRQSGGPKMSTDDLVLAIDFGERGFGVGRKERFRVRLDGSPLLSLILAAEDARRVYELLLIDRPGDVWDYIWVALDDVPGRVIDRLAHSRQDHQRAGLYRTFPSAWPQDRVPFKVFDGLFRWMGDDTGDEDEAWLRWRQSDTMRSFSNRALSMVRATRERLESSDVLFRHIAASARSGSHPFCYLDRDVARTESREPGFTEARHTPAFYEKLACLLRDPDLASVAYVAEGDYRILRMMATEQRRRAEITGHRAGHALRLTAMVDEPRINNEAWDSELWFQEEGSPRGDLFIAGGGLGRIPRPSPEPNSPTYFKFLLCTQDAGPVEGYTTEVGEGWVLYVRDKPESRRSALERVRQDRRNAGPILSFLETGATLFSQEQTVFVVGANIPVGARATLASIVAEWQELGGEPLLLVVGDTKPFDLAGCKRVLSAAAHGGDETALGRWFAVELQQSQPWIDAVIALEAPEWATKVLADQVQDRERPWPAWVVATAGESPLKIDQVLEGELDRVLSMAQLHAKKRRPRR